MNYNPTEQRRREEIARRKKAVRQQTISSQIPVADPRKQPLSEAQKLRQRRTQKPKEESKESAEGMAFGAGGAPLPADPTIG